MDEFLKKINLSDDAINIYLKSLGRSSLTYYELYSFVPNLSTEKFENVLNELINADLLLQIIPRKPEILPQYLTIPPIGPIINYYDNIKASFSNIEDALQDLLVNSLNQIFEKSCDIEIDSLYAENLEARKDFEDESLLLKKDIDDIIEGMENLNKLKSLLSNLQQRMGSITKTQFARLIKETSNIKTEIEDGGSHSVRSFHERS